MSLRKDLPAVPGASRGLQRNQERVAAHLAQISSPQSMARGQDDDSDWSEIMAGLRSVPDDVRALRGERAELQARLLSVEQIVARDGARGESFQTAGPAIGASVLSGLQEDPSFQAAADAVSRGMRTSSFAARVGTSTSIRAALVGDSNGSSNVDYPVAPQRGGIITPPMRNLRLLDALPSRPTSSDAVEFVQLSATGEASEQDQQGDTKAELDFNGELKRAEIATIAGWTGASKQVLADAAGLQNAINVVIQSKVLSRLENQLINGTGATGKINGLMNQATTFIPTIGTTPADVIGEALVRQANNGYLPNLVLMNPLDFFSLQLERTYGEGTYMFGSPTMPLPPVLWNTSIVLTPSMPEGKGMTLDNRFTTVLDRELMNITVSNQHADFFVRNLVAILGELRAGLEVTDTLAVYKFDLPELVVSSGP